MKKVIVFFLIIPFWNSLFAQTDFNNSTIVIPEFIDRSFNFSLFDKTSLVLASDVNGDEIIDLFVSGETPRHRMDVRSIELILGLDDSEEISFQSISWPIFSSSGTNSMSLFGSKALITTHRKDNSIYVHSFHTSEGASERLAIDLDSVDNALGVDFNNDRVKDILISSESEGKIRWLENNGEGEFNNTYLIGNTGTESKFFMGDINGDNYEDVITYNYDFDSGFEIIWFENKGDNKWGIAQSITDFRYKLLDFGMADLNNDGRQDIYYVANLFKIMWVPNEGDGKFGTPRLIHQVDVSEHNYRQLIHTDIDSDGDQDLIANLSPHILIFENDGSGSFNIQFDETFKSPENLGNRTEFYNTIALFDLELDGDEDILINRSSDGATLFLKNNGNAEFVEEEYPNLALGIYNSHTAGSFIHVADMDKDDDFDIVTYTEINSEPILAWYENLGEENFSEINIIDENIYIMGIHSADIDSDGDIDILVGMDEEGLVQYENQSGNFVKKDKSLVSNYYGYDFLALSDLEADSVIDIVFSWGLEFTYGGISWRQNDGSGYFGAERFVSDNAEGVKDIRAADIDNDGDQDIIASLITQNKLVYFLNNSNGEFGEMSQISEIEFGGYILIPSDLDNDGDIDILTASSTAETLSPEERENRTESDELMWFENLGDLSFKKNHISYNRVSTLNVSDLDNDGYKDIISGDREHGVLRWYRNTGSGSFESARKISVLLKGIQSIYTVDLDNDGDDDIVTNSDHSGKIIIFENVGGNESIRRKDEFSLKQNYPNPFNPSTIIEYGIQEKTFVNISIFNLLGEKVRTLVNESKNKGYYSIQFNASELASGVYFYRLKTVNFVETKKLTIIK